MHINLISRLIHATVQVSGGGGGGAMLLGEEEKITKNVHSMILG